MPQLKIREMPQDERPREKLLARGADALSNAELIAILLRTGRRGMNVVDVARELLYKYKSFAELSRCSVKELSEIKGIGPAKALELVAAFNLGKRFPGSGVAAKTRLTGTDLQTTRRRNADAADRITARCPAGHTIPFDASRIRVRGKHE